MQRKYRIHIVYFPFYVKLLKILSYTLILIEVFLERLSSVTMRS